MLSRRDWEVSDPILLFCYSVLLGLCPKERDLLLCVCSCGYSFCTPKWTVGYCGLFNLCNFDWCVLKNSYKLIVIIFKTHLMTVDFTNNHSFIVDIIFSHFCIVILIPCHHDIQMFVHFFSMDLYFCIAHLFLFQSYYDCPEYSTLWQVNKIQFLYNTLHNEKQQQCFPKTNGSKTGDFFSVSGGKQAPALSMKSKIKKNHLLHWVLIHSFDRG